MIWRTEGDKEFDFLLKEWNVFKQISGQHLCKILGYNPEWRDYEFSFLGSSGLLEYNGKYFVITNHHVVQNIPYDQRLDQIMILTGKEGIATALFVDHKADRDNDIAAFEINSNDLLKLLEKTPLSSEKLETNPYEHLKNKCNNVLLHGFPAERSEMDYDNKIGEITTFPYATFAKGYDENLDMFELDVTMEGINEYESIVKIPALYGMSGSFVYTITDELVPYKCFGLLSNGKRESGSMWVIPINCILNFLNRAFF